MEQVLKIALIVTDSYSAWHFRRSLITGLIEKNNDVYILTPKGSHVEQLQSLGAKHIPLAVTRFLDPIGDLKFMIELYRICRREKFDIVHNFSVKPNTYGAIAAKIAGVKNIIGSVTGLGQLFGETENNKNALLKHIVIFLYRIGFTISNRIWLQNNDDIELLIALRVIGNRKKTVLVKSSGVDIDYFCMQKISRTQLEKMRKEIGASESTKFVIMIARPLKTKGVQEYIDASITVGQSNPDVCFLLAGGFEENNPANIPKEILYSKRYKNFKYLAWRDDIRELIALSDIVVLPSYYREGVPKSLIEGLSMGKPIVTTNNVGCRETVVDEKNGYLISPRNSKVLSKAIEKIINDPEKMELFGNNSREKAEKEFSEKLVVNELLKQLYKIKA